jgi:hypothetical protein
MNPNNINFRYIHTHHPTHNNNNKRQGLIHSPSCLGFFFFQYWDFHLCIEVGGCILVYMYFFQKVFWWSKFKRKSWKQSLLGTLFYFLESVSQGFCFFLFSFYKKTWKSHHPVTKKGEGAKPNRHPN